jgi:hypothetical protein
VHGIVPKGGLESNGKKLFRGRSRYSRTRGNDEMTERRNTGVVFPGMKFAEGVETDDKEQGRRFKRMKEGTDRVN